MGLDTSDLDRKSATLPHTPGRLSLKLPLKDRDTRTQFCSAGTPSSPTSSTISLISEPMTVPFVHKNPSHASEAFNSLNQMRANNEVRITFLILFYRNFMYMAHFIVCSSLHYQIIWNGVNWGIDDVIIYIPYQANGFFFLLLALRCVNCGCHCFHSSTQSCSGCK